jgi:hypothetical protein
VFHAPSTSGHLQWVNEDQKCCDSDIISLLHEIESGKGRTRPTLPKVCFNGCCANLKNAFESENRTANLPNIVVGSGTASAAAIVWIRGLNMQRELDKCQLFSVFLNVLEHYRSVCECGLGEAAWLSSLRFEI